MTISIFVRDVDPGFSKSICNECNGYGYIADGSECFACDAGYVTDYVYPDGMEPISMGNTNAATVIAAIDKQFNPKDPCGYWDRDRMSVVLAVVDAMLATDAYDFLVRDTKVEGRVTHIGIDSSYLKHRLEQIRGMILAARKAGKTVAYA